jgi:hypothetical protein
MEAEYRSAGQRLGQALVASHPACQTQTHHMHTITVNTANPLI